MRNYEVKSRIITAVSYNPNTMQLLIHFKKGSKHCYLQVPPGQYAALMNASSIGRYYQKNIRSNYEYEKLA